VHAIRSRRAPAAFTTLKSVLAGVIGAGVLALAYPAHALVAEVATSIAASTLANDEDLQVAIQSAVMDVLKRAVAFTPSLVQLQQAKLVGGRIYLLLLIADPEGEETLRVFATEQSTD
jgi:hypothetical protein